MSGLRFTHPIDIRYGECDQQGVVFNANYLAYVDDAMDHWMRSLGDNPWTSEWDVMLKAARITWHGPARWPETVSVDCGIARWGRTSFDVLFRLRVDDREVADVLVTYVSVTVDTHQPSEPPPLVVAALGDPVPLPPSLAPQP
jgi:acyl-CoA thioester hydrolase